MRHIELRKFSILFILAIGILCTACSSEKSEEKDSPNKAVNDAEENSDAGQNNETVQNSEVVITMTPVAEPTIEPASEKSLAMEVYRAILQNEGVFYEAESKKEFLLNDYWEEYFKDNHLQLTHFTVIDMDADDKPEVVIQISDMEGYPVYYLVLHHTNEKVYGYPFVLRGLLDLKTDGTFWASGGASDNACNKLIFNNGSYEEITLAYSKSGGDNVFYYIHDQETTQENFDAFVKTQDAKTSVEWYELTERNIEKELSIE